MKLYRKRFADMTEEEIRQFADCWNNLSRIPERLIENVGLDAGNDVWLMQWMEDNIPFDQYDVVKAFGRTWLMAVHPGIVRKGHPEDYWDAQAPSVVPRTMTCRWYHPMPPRRKD